MANHGSKFESVNLNNKSYGQHHHHPSHHTHYSDSNGGGGSYGQASAAGRGRSGSGGMVVLSRNRGAPAKVAPKLSIPPPLNLPSLRKEHEKFDTSGPGGGSGTGSGSRPTSAGVGWTKPIADERGVDNLVPGVDGMNAMAGAGRGAGSYTRSSARSNGVGVVGSASRDYTPHLGKAMVLGGEDFPSLQAARSVSSSTSQKQKGSYHLESDNGCEGHGVGSGQRADQIWKQGEYFPDPLPLVHMNPRSDWADDERDTGHGFAEQRRCFEYSNHESYWDRDFDLPRPSILPHKAAPTQYDMRGQLDNGSGKNSSSEVLKIDPYEKDVRAPSRDGREVNTWRASLPFNDEVSSQEGNYGVDIGARTVGNKNIVKENKYTPPHYRDTGRDSTSGTMDLGVVGQQQQQGYNTTETLNSSRGAELNSRDHYVNEQSTRYKGENFQKNELSKSMDPILTMGRNKHFPKSDGPFSDDPFSYFSSTGFDGSNPFSGGFIGVIKRKEQAANLTVSHNPVWESFEAEGEGVEKTLDIERQRIIKEQERALDEERQRWIREEELRQRLEEEAHEAAWRAEQERPKAIGIIAREEERRRMELEEERRKQAAKQKLLELEAKIAKRQAESAKVNV